MDTRSPRAGTKRTTARAKPQVIRSARLTGQAAAREFRRLVRDIHGEMRRRGMSEKDIRELRKWLSDV